MSEDLNRSSADLFSEPMGFPGDPQEQQAPRQDIPLHERLMDYGVPEELAREVRDGSLRQSDYTRKTQELSQRLAAVEAQRQQVDTLMQWALTKEQGQQPQHKSQFDKTWEELTKGEDSPQLEPIKKLHEAQQQDFANQVNRELQAVRQQLAEYQAREVYDQIYQNAVMPQYGNHLDDVWPQAVAMSKEYMRRGQTVDPLTVIAQLDPARIANAAMKHQQQRQQNNNGATVSPEGMYSQRSAQPSDGQAQKPKGDEYSSENILARVMAKMRREGVSA